MRSLLAFLLPAAALSILTAIAVGIIISASQGHPSLLLVGAFGLDSVALLVIAWKLCSNRASWPR